MKRYAYLVIILLMSCSGNSDEQPTGGFNNDDIDSPPLSWLIPIEEVVDGGPGRDGIPSIDNPVFINANSAEASFLEDDDLVVGIISGNEIKAYPHLILDWHEVVNDVINGQNININYCPLTGTAFGWKNGSNSTSTFGVSGLLYNSNLILYDRETNSNWAQLKLLCVNGDLISDTPELVKIVETNWGTWKSLYPSTKLMSTDTGFDRSYGDYPYGSYLINDDFLIFPVSPLNPQLPNKERVFAILLGNTSKVYRFSDFIGGKIVVEEVLGQSYLIAGNDKIIKAFKLDASHENSEFQLNTLSTSSFISDAEGNTWDVFGNITNSTDAVNSLTDAKSVVGYWFAIAAFYPNPLIYGI